MPEIHAFGPRSNSSFTAPHMLMDCPEGDVGMDLGMEVPPKHKQAFVENLAKMHISKDSHN